VIGGERWGPRDLRGIRPLNRTGWALSSFLMLLDLFSTRLALLGGQRVAARRPLHALDPPMDHYFHE